MVTLDLTIEPALEETIEVEICQGYELDFHGQTLTESGSYVAEILTPEGCDSIITLNLTVLPAIESSYEVEICYGGEYDFHGQTITEEGVYSATLSTAEGCDSIVTLNLTVAPILEGYYEMEICQGSEYHFHGQILSEPGTYEAELTTNHGCDSLVTLDLTVLPAIQGYKNVSICNGQTYDFHGETLSSSGTYTHTLQTSTGCDSVINLQLTVLPAAQEHITRTICQGQTYDFHGQNLEESGNYTAELTTSEGCDSIVHLNLIVYPAIQSQVSATVCHGQTYDFNGEALSESGRYTAELTTPDGCDSIVTLNLTVLPIKESTKEVEICSGGSYEYNGEVYTEGGIHVIEFTTPEGCDSLVNLAISVLPPVEENIEAHICDGEVYHWHGQSLTSSGTYTTRVQTAEGCDSIVILKLFVQPDIEKEINIEWCTGSEYYFDGQYITESGTYTGVFESQAGCDSIVTLNINFTPVLTSEKTATICQGDTYYYNGAPLEEAGVYSFDYVTPDGCDSIVVLTLNTTNPPEKSKTASICQGQTYDFLGTELFEPGTYYGVQSNPGECDTIIALTLIVTPPEETFIQATICEGSYYEFDGLMLSESGSYQKATTNSDGCEIIVNLDLTVLPAPVKVLNEAVCQGGSFYFNGSHLYEEGTYEYLLTTQEGCDSIVIVNLTVLPPPQGGEIAYFCPGGTYNFHGQILYEPGNYSATISTPSGCDSIAHLDLRLTDIIQNEISAEFCEGGTYEFNGNLLTEPGTYIDTFQTSGGCDSIVILTLEAAPEITEQLNVEICQGQSFYLTVTGFLKRAPIAQSL
ncbi:MAG: hypothetical protein EA411_13130 [Saprospirales bacterium]|nr:MAG: hypothetical protein EA411_13130 [Saprospirales bacterium]